jgi:hypothetical protein
LQYQIKQISMIKSVKSEQGVFSYANSKEKQEYRQHKLNCLKPFADKINGIITLSADNLSFEEMIANDKSFSKLSVIDSYEIKKETYEKGLPKYKKLKKRHQILRYKNENIFNANFGEHDCVVADLDLCGTFTIKFLNDIASSLQQIKQGLAFVTIFKDTRISNLSKYVEYFGVNSLQEFRDNVFVPYIENLCGVKLYTQPYEYKNKSVNPNAKQMILYVFVKNIEWKNSDLIVKQKEGVK